MKLLSCLLLIVMLGCQTKSAADLGPEQTEPAFIYGNSVPNDGCEEFVRIDHGNPATDTQYKPTARSLPILQKAITDLSANPTAYEQSVTIRFAETGKQVTLQCGWGSRPQLAEIEILSISKR